MQKLYADSQSTLKKPMSDPKTPLTTMKEVHGEEIIKKHSPAI